MLMLDNVLFFFTFHLPKKKKQISPFEQEKKKYVISSVTPVGQGLQRL